MSLPLMPTQKGDRVTRLANLRRLRRLGAGAGVPASGAAVTALQ
jgi:hypothetical protein